MSWRAPKRPGPWASVWDSLISKIQSPFEQAVWVAFSSNYTLYGDMSRRVMETLKGFTRDVEVYSIEEAFLLLQDAMPLLTALGRQLQKTVRRWTGLPVSIGFAPTKTLAKVANKVAKSGEGVCNLVDDPALDQVLADFSVEDLWGIGPKYRNVLHAHGIKNAYQFSRIDEQWARKRLIVMGQRTVLELRGIPCFRLDEQPPPKKAIARARQFGRTILELGELYEPLAAYVASAARELRRQQGVAGALWVSLETSRFIEHPYRNSMFRQLPWPTAHTGELIQWAGEILERIYRPDCEYRRCGVMLTELAPQEELQTNLFTAEYYDRRKRNVMATVDRINARWGRETMRHAREGLQRDWRMRQMRRSPRYTTRWDEIAVVVL